ncbi:MAG: hypothetical protein HGA81_08590 [Chlorobium limicola]|nr:hypothetical protein [Chlorobium limicola]NTV08645.1 hypothetical protein [Chlorobium limicola]
MAYQNGQERSRCRSTGYGGVDGACSPGFQYIGDAIPVVSEGCLVL